RARPARRARVGGRLPRRSRHESETRPRDGNDHDQSGRPGRCAGGARTSARSLLVMTITGPMRPMLHARDLDETIAFYTDVLGFEVASTIRDDRFNWCALTYGRGAVMFTCEETRRPALSG